VLALVAEVTDRPVWVLAIATIVLAAAAWGALLGLIESRKARNSQVLAALSVRWESPYIYESFRACRRLKRAGTIELIKDLYDPNVENPDLHKMTLWHQVEVWPNLLETVGGFWREGVMAERLIYRMWGGTIIAAWEKDWREPARHIRDLTGDQTLWQNFQLLAEAMVRFRAREARRSGRWWIDSPGCMPSPSRAASECRSGGESRAEPAVADRMEVDSSSGTV
jgi:hypothetical protein